MFYIILYCGLHCDNSQWMGIQYLSRTSSFYIQLYVELHCDNSNMTILFILDFLVILQPQHWLIRIYFYVGLHYSMPEFMLDFIVIIQLWLLWFISGFILDFIVIIHPQQLLIGYPIFMLDFIILYPTLCWTS